ncbi:MAG: hypothetical protein U0414_21795 [Polyangiaceae bacterium]
MTKIVDYVWTKQDQQIWKGMTAGTAQGPFVSPYGIRRECVKSPPEKGHPTQLDLGWSYGGELGRATRFHGPDSWTRKVDEPRDHPYEWIEIDWEIPPTVKTIGQLCEYLIAKDPVQFPPEIYSQRPPRKWNLNAAMMLFDYWGNSAFRYAVSAEDFDWDGDYLDKPDEIAIAHGDLRLTWVLRRRTIVSTTAAPPAKTSTPPSAPTQDGGGLPDIFKVKRYAPGELEAKVDAYTESLETVCREMKWLADVSDAAMQRRCAVLRSARAIRAAAFVSTLSAPHGNDDAVDIVSSLDAVIPDARDWLMQQPIAQTERVPMQPLTNSDLVLGGDIRRQTHNARADMDTAVEKLDGLLFGEQWLEWMEAWSLRVVSDMQDHTLNIDWDALQRGAKATGTEISDPALAVLARQSRLEKALASAVEWYGEAGFPYDGAKRTMSMTPDGLRALLDGAPESHAASAAALGGESSPLGAAIKLTGKFYSFGKSVSKIGVALLRTCVAWDTLKLAKSALQTGGVSTAKAFADGIIARLPDLDLGAAEAADRVKLRSEARQAIQQGDKEAARKLAAKIAKKAVNEAEAWKNLCGVLNVLNLMVALSSVTSTSDSVVATVNWLALGTDTVDVALGSAGRLLSALGGFEGVVAKLEYLGTHVGVIGALLAFVQGGLALIDALCAAKKDPGEIVRASALFLGGAATLFTVAAAYFGLSTGGVGLVIEVFGIACLMAVGAVDLGRMIAKDTLFVESMRKLVGDLRHQVEWSAFEAAKLDIRLTMSEVEEYAKGARGLLPGANVMDHWRHLRANGFSDDAITKLLSVGAASAPLDADATWEGARAG